MIFEAYGTRGLPDPWNIRMFHGTGPTLKISFQIESLKNWRHIIPFVCFFGPSSLVLILEREIHAPKSTGDFWTFKSYGIWGGEFDGKSWGYLCGYPESITFGVVLRVSEGVYLKGNHTDIYADIPNL